MANGLQSRQEPRWSRRKDARPEEITAAALDLFVERGYAATRLEDVAARAGVSKGTLYLYFANKEDLFKAVIREVVVARLTQFRDEIGQFQGSTIDLLRMMLRTWWRQVGSTPISGIPKLIISEARNFPEIARFYMDEVVRPGQETLAMLVQRGIARGEFRRVDPKLAVNLLTAPLLLICVWRNSLEPFATEALDAQALLEAHLDMLARGLAAAGD